MMKVRLKNINTVRKRLADGTIAIYYYAWKGGPRLTGKPNSPEFSASYEAAVKFRPNGPVKDIAGLIDKYTSSKHFDSLKDSSKIVNLRRFRKIKATLGELPLSVFADPNTIDVLEDWRKKVAEHSTSDADGQWSSLSAMLTWAARRRLVKANLCEGGGHVHNGSRVDKIWSERQVAQFCRSAPPHLVVAFMLALWSGQREGSLVKLRWSAYDGQCLTVEQEKNRRNQPPKVVVIPVRGPFKEFLDQLESQAGVNGLCADERHQRHIVLNRRGKPWASAASFATGFGRISDGLGIEDRTFHDLRGTAVTRLARAGCTIPEIAAITGHSLKTVHAILDKHYLHRDIILAEQAMDKRVAYENSQLSAQLAQIIE
jgi:integrase